MSQKAFRLTLAMLTAAGSLAAVASPAVAQTNGRIDGHPLKDPTPFGSRPTARIEPGRGRIPLQTAAQREMAYRTMPAVEEAVGKTLANPEQARFTNLRSGQYREALVICGVVSSTNAEGVLESRRFIARPSVATLESNANAAAFTQGWRQTGCGV